MEDRFQQIIVEKIRKQHREAFDKISSLLRGEEAIVYYGYPLYLQDGEFEIFPEILIAHRDYGVIVGQVVHEGNIEMDNEGILDELLHQVKIKIDNSKELRNKISVTGILFYDDEKHDVSTTNEKIISISYYLSQTTLDLIVRRLRKNNIENITYEQFDLLKKLLNDTLSYCNKSYYKNYSGNIRKEVIHKIKEFIGESDRKQELLGKVILDGPQRIRGIAGSGKSVLLAQRAALMHLRYPEWNIALIFFTRSLYETTIENVRKWIRIFSNNTRDYDVNGNLRIYQAWGEKNGQEGFFSHICKINSYEGTQDFNNEKYSKYTPLVDKLAYQCSELLRSNNGNLFPYFDAVFIDEGQDFMCSSEYKYEGKQPFYYMAYRSLKDVAKEGEGNKHINKRLTWAYDEAQSLKNLEIPKATEIFGDTEEVRNMFKGQYTKDISKSEIMRKCYRTPGEILVAAHAVAMGVYREEGMLRGITNKEQWEKIGYRVEEGEFRSGRDITISRPRENSPNPTADLWQGRLIEFTSYDTREEELRQVAIKIMENIEDGLDCKEHILVIALGEYQQCNNLKYLMAEKLRNIGINYYIPTANSINSFPTNGNEDKNRFYAENAVTISCTKRAKGNERSMIYVIGVDTIANKENHIALRNQLFVAMTRSKSWLSISGTGEHPLYKEMRKAIEGEERMDFTFKRMPQMEIED